MNFDLYGKSKSLRHSATFSLANNVKMSSGDYSLAFAGQKLANVEDFQQKASSGKPSRQRLLSYCLPLPHAHKQIHTCRRTSEARSIFLGREIPFERSRNAYPEYICELISIEQSWGVMLGNVLYKHWAKDGLGSPGHLITLLFIKITFEVPIKNSLLLYNEKAY